jgi:hypothetical protein
MNISVDFSGDIIEQYSTPHRYYQNGIDVTWYVINERALPHSERFFEVTVR